MFKVYFTQVFKITCIHIRLFPECNIYIFTAESSVQKNQSNEIKTKGHLILTTEVKTSPSTILLKNAIHLPT